MRDYRKLDVYQETRGLARDIYCATSTLPLYLRWRLGAQLDNAVESIGANLAEGSGRKNVGHGNSELVRYGHIAFGSACEVEHRLQGLRDRDLIPEVEFALLAARIGKVKAMLLTLIGIGRTTIEEGFPTLSPDP
jgi:four helix bundle protein